MRDRAIWFGADPGRPLQADPTGRLLVRIGAATGLIVDAAIAGAGIVCLLEEWLRPYRDSGAREPVLESWRLAFSGSFLYCPGRRRLPAPLREFVDFIRAWSREQFALTCPVTVTKRQAHDFRRSAGNYDWHTSCASVAFPDNSGGRRRVRRGRVIAIREGCACCPTDEGNDRGGFQRRDKA